MSRILIFGGVGALVILGAIITLLLPRESTDTPTSSTWGTIGGLFSFDDPSTLPSALPSTPQAPAQGAGVDHLGVVPLPQRSVDTGEDTSGGFAADLAALLTQLTAPPQSTQNTAEYEPPTPSGYAFIPQGFITVQAPPQLTPAQETLREYGNSVGSLLAAFADLHPTMPQTLKDHAEDRDDGQKVAALKRLGDDFVRLGDELALYEVPPAATPIHNGLVAAYRDVGAKLSRVADTRADQAFLDAVNTYNTSAETLSKQLVAFVDFFVVQGVIFSSTDAGSIFTFSGSSSF